MTVSKPYTKMTVKPSAKIGVEGKKFQVGKVHPRVRGGAAIAAS